MGGWAGGMQTGGGGRLAGRSGCKQVVARGCCSGGSGTGRNEGQTPEAEAEAEQRRRRSEAGEEAPCISSAHLARSMWLKRKQRQVTGSSSKGEGASAAGAKGAGAAGAAGAAGSPRRPVVGRQTGWGQQRAGGQDGLEDRRAWRADGLEGRRAWRADGPGGQDGRRPEPSGPQRQGLATGRRARMQAGVCRGVAAGALAAAASQRPVKGRRSGPLQGAQPAPAPWARHVACSGRRARCCCCHREGPPPRPTAGPGVLAALGLGWAGGLAGWRGGGRRLVPGHPGQ